MLRLENVYKQKFYCQVPISLKPSYIQWSDWYRAAGRRSALTVRGVFKAFNGENLSREEEKPSQPSPP